jgi:4-amino-4-deoxy-L-arabinose transferase-like glycosyltransferase
MGPPEETRPLAVCGAGTRACRADTGVGAWLIAALILVGAGLRLGNMSNVTSRTPDERVYTTHANVWIASGEAGLRTLTANYLASADAKLYPKPTRVGMARLVALAIRATGRVDESAGAWVSCLASIGSLIALAWIGVRFFPLPAAATALLFFAVFPGELAIARRAWADAPAEFFCLLVILLGCEIMRSPGRYWLYAAFGFFGAVGISVKEAILLPYALFALCVPIALYMRDRTIKKPLLFCAAAAILPALGVLWMGHEVGGLSSFLSVVGGIADANAHNAYALDYQSGPWYLFLYAFWIVSPALSALAALGMLDSLMRRRDPVFWIALSTALFLAIAMALPHWINLRYAAFVFGPVCLLAGAGVSWLMKHPALRSVPANRLIACLSVALIACAVGDYLRFQRFFVRDSTPDLAIRFLVEENRR